MLESDQCYREKSGEVESARAMNRRESKSLSQINVPYKQRHD